jgi:hypothetical protein
MHSGSPVVPSPVLLLLLDADTAPVLVSSVVLELVLVVGSGPVLVPVPVADIEPAVVEPLSVVVGVSVVVTAVEPLLELAAVSLALSVVVLPSSVHAASAGATSEIP